MTKTPGAELSVASHERAARRRRPVPGVTAPAWTTTPAGRPTARPPGRPTNPADRPAGRQSARPPGRPFDRRGVRPGAGQTRTMRNSRGLPKGKEYDLLSGPDRLQTAAHKKEGCEKTGNSNGDAPNEKTPPRPPRGSPAKGIRKNIRGSLQYILCG